METAARNKLKQFIEDHIAFEPLKKAGFFGKGIRKTDYEKIAERICTYFGIKSIYEYTTISANADRKTPVTWDRLQVDHADMVTNEKWLN